ncbi:hypothetical protein ACEE74_11490, partial [Streptococcus orisratti]
AIGFTGSGCPQRTFTSDVRHARRTKKNRKGSVTFTVIGNSNSIVWRLYFYFQGEKYRCTGRNFFNWFPAVL